MVNTTLVVIDGTVLTLIFSAFVVGTILWKPRIWMHDFPADIQALMPPKTADEKRLTTVLGIPFLVIIAGGLGLTAVRYGAQNGLLWMALHVYLVWQIVNVVDLLVIDWGGMFLIDPQHPPFPGTEGARGYRDFTFHLVGFLKGSAMGLVMAAAISGVVWPLLRCSTKSTRIATSPAIRSASVTVRGRTTCL